MTASDRNDDTLRRTAPNSTEAGDDDRLAGQPEPPSSGTSALTYDEVGATLNASLPAGYHHLEHRVPVTHGAAGFRAAADALLTWQMHQVAGLDVTASSPRATQGVTVTSRLRLGPLRMTAPCLVVWADDQAEADRAGFGYGTLPGHPESGEESFVLTRDSDDTVWLTIRAFSRPATLLPRLAGPVGPLLQRRITIRYANALRRLVSAEG